MYAVKRCCCLSLCHVANWPISVLYWTEHMSEEVWSLSYAHQDTQVRRSCVQHTYRYIMFYTSEKAESLSYAQDTPVGRLGCSMFISHLWEWQVKPHHNLSQSTSSEVSKLQYEPSKPSTLDILWYSPLFITLTNLWLGTRHKAILYNNNFSVECTY